MPNTLGADDNASAVAVMLAVAKALGWRKDVMYTAFNGRECNLAGSLEFVKDMADELKLLEQVHVLEMVDYRDLHERLPDLVHAQYVELDGGLLVPRSARRIPQSLYSASTLFGKGILATEMKSAADELGRQLLFASSKT